MKRIFIWVDGEVFLPKRISFMQLNIKKRVTIFYFYSSIKDSRGYENLERGECTDLDISFQRGRMMIIIYFLLTSASRVQFP